MATEAIDFLMTRAKLRSVFIIGAGSKAITRQKIGEAEIDMLRLLNLGMTNREIANRLTMTIATTKWRITQIFGKLSVRNRTEAVLRARQLKLL